ncbi:MAG: hypothetical protein AB7E46_02715 [Desulfovibrio sp.]|jgi:hypothetical protein
MQPETVPQIIHAPPTPSFLVFGPGLKLNSHAAEALSIRNNEAKTNVSFPCFLALDKLKTKI